MRIGKGRRQVSFCSGTEIAALVAQRDHFKAALATYGAHPAGRAKDVGKFAVRTGAGEYVCDAVDAALFLSVRLFASCASIR
jgi:dienelactone hydrolase